MPYPAQWIVYKLITRQEVSSKLTEAWKVAREKFKKVQKHQYDKFIKNSKFCDGDICSISL